MKKTKLSLYPLLAGIFVACLLISNILASKTFTLGSFVLPTAVIIFPVVYIVNDMLAEIYGFKRTRDIILLGFVLNLFAVIAYTIAIYLPAPVFALEGATAFETVLSSTPRILLASFTAYLIGSLLNAKIMAVLKAKSGNKLFTRCMLSTIVGEGLDACIFISIAFAGVMGLVDLLTMIIAQAVFKVTFEFVCYPVTRRVINKVKSLSRYDESDITI